MNPRPSKRAQDPCTVATYVREMLLIAEFNRIQRRANLYRELEQSLARLSSTSSTLRRACRLGYRGASDRLYKRVNRYGYELYRDLGTIVHQQGADLRVPSVPELCSELKQIEDEFGGWLYKSRSRTISVKTGPIHLDDVYLGPFAIELTVYRLSNFKDCHTGPHPFQVIALDPHPASGNKHITHPHVSDDHLCTGESSFLISAALMEGRLADFFLIVRGLLQTYNPDSPYVPLDSWSGTSCNECGERVHEDDRYYCEGCNCDVCDGCSGRCNNCDDTACLGCLINCKHCEEYSCRGCTKRCAECNENCCTGCLEDELCPTCVQEKENLDNDEEEQAETTHPENTVEVATAGTPAT